MAKLVAVRLQRDIEALLASRKPLAKGTRAISASYFTRPLEKDQAPLLFLVHAAKRGIPNSPDRNKQKRRMREALRTLSIYDVVEQQLIDRSQQVLVHLRTTKPPSRQVSWEVILADMETIGKRLQEVLARA